MIYGGATFYLDGKESHESSLALTIAFEIVLSELRGNPIKLFYKIFQQIKVSRYAVIVGKTMWFHWDVVCFIFRECDVILLLVSIPIVTSF